MAAALQQRPRTPLQAGDVLVVIHDFEARGADELTLRKTDQIELVELDDGFGDGWYLGRHLGQGATGLFPGVYTAKLPPNFTPVGFPGPRMMPPPERPRMEEKPLPPNPPARPSGDASQRSSISPPLANFLSRSSVSAPGPSQIPGVHRSIGQTLANKPGGEERESPVMNETLSVINEHITDLNTPRLNLAPPQHQDDSGSEYSSHLDLASYITGPETDSEEHLRLTVADVKGWDAKQTAEYLRGLGVDPKHCEIFEDQEITGDVLLEMDQSFIHMKDFDFGLMGRRLKTWHKIRDFQDQVRNGKDSKKKATSKQNGSSEEGPRIHSRALSGNATILPRIPSLMEEPGLSIRQSQHTHPYIQVGSASPPLEPARSPTPSSRPQLGASTPPSPWRASIAAESPSRPPPSSNRASKHSRRHSSIEFAQQFHDVQETPQLGTVTSLPPPHKKAPSLDRDWSMSNATTNAGASTPSLKLNISRQPDSVDISTTDSAFDGESSNLDLDRGYFSGNEVENRKSRNLLKKRESATHSRHSSMLLDEPSKAVASMKRHSRLSSVDSIPIKDRRPPVTSSAAKAYHSSSYKARFRSSSAKNLNTPQPAVALSPTVTNLEDDSTSVLSSPKAPSGPTSPTAYAPWSAAQKAIKLLGLRAASDAVTGNEKEAASSLSITHDPLKESPVAASPSGSQTPSATSRSFEIDNTDTSSKGTTEHLGPLLHTKTALRPVPKTKRQTSAYTRGLLQLSPAEARKDCDYHGWMKKRSTGIIAQWKPRLFILRGRRLSYYYAETDTEEKGIIDISGHKVLGATADPLASLHATITGASSTPSVGTAATSADPSLNAPRTSGGGAPFYFKLVPPKVGTSRAVQFTRPTVHFFQVENIAQGRKWMGEILKATIEHDLSSYETTNRQKTITLAKARARQERPPALKDAPKETEEVAELPDKPSPLQEKDEQETGLNITGLDFSQSDVDLQLRAAPPDENKENQDTPVDADEKPKTSD